MNKQYIKTYGYVKCHTGYMPVVNGEVSCTLIFKRFTKAHEVARKLVVCLFKPFTNFQGEQVSFTYVDAGDMTNEISI